MILGSFLPLPLLLAAGPATPAPALRPSVFCLTVFVGPAALHVGASGSVMPAIPRTGGGCYRWGDLAGSLEKLHRLFPLESGVDVLVDAAAPKDAAAEVDRVIERAGLRVARTRTWRQPGDDGGFDPQPYLAELRSLCAGSR